MEVCLFLFVQEFVKCGLTGWCMEVFWTGTMNLIQKDRKMCGNTSLLMFPIYGMAAVIKPMSKLMKNRNFIMRGTVYTCGIYAMEYVSGRFLKKKEMCPWDYSKCKYNIDGVIRLDYAPVWFTTGLLYEKILK